MDSLIKTLQKYKILTDKNKSSHWKFFLNNKNIKNISINFGFGSFERETIIRSFFHYILSRLLFGFKISCILLSYSSATKDLKFLNH